MIITATLIQYANGTFFVQAPGSNINEVAGQISTFGVLTASLIPNLDYGITILPPEGTSYSRFGALFTAQSDGTQDITAILTAAIPPPVGFGGTVTNQEGVLTAGSIVVGNGGSDVTVVPGMDFGKSKDGFLTVPAVILSDTPNSGADGLIFQVTSNNADQTAIIIQNTSSGQVFAMGVLGSNAAIKGQIAQDGATGALFSLSYSTSPTTPFIVAPAHAVNGWASGDDPTSNPIDTGLSRTVAGAIAIGNGTQGNASGRADYATHLGPTVAPSGAGVAGAWCFSQDGKVSFCNAGTWEVIVP